MVDILDVAKSDAFGSVELTDAINKMPHKPRRIAGMGLFDVRGIPTTRMYVEVKNGVLGLVPAKVRGDAPTAYKGGQRQMVPIEATHHPVQDQILPGEVQDITEFGTGRRMNNAQAVRDEKLLGMRDSLEATLEFQRINALKGKVLDADNTTVLLNLFDAFGIQEPGSTSLDLDASDPADGALDTAIQDVIRTVEDALGDQPYDEIRAFCGSTFFNKLVSHPDVRETWRALQTQQLIERKARREINVSGIVFEEYRGNVGGKKYVDDNDAHVFPVGVPRFALTRFAPPNRFGFENTEGVPIFAQSTPDDKGTKIDLDAESNPINVISRPDALVPLTV